MIIKRCYVPFCKLKETDQEAIEFFDKVFNETYLWLSGKEKDMEYQKLISQCLYQLDVENALEKFMQVKKYFELLDKLKPYDNGLTYKDVNSVEVVKKQKNSIALRLINNGDTLSQIVSVLDVVNEPKETELDTKDVFDKIAELYLRYKQGKQVSFAKELNELKKYLLKVAQFAKTEVRLSISQVQVKFNIGYPKAAKTVDLFEKLCLIIKTKYCKEVVKENVEDFIAFLENN